MEHRGGVPKSSSFCISLFSYQWIVRSTDKVDAGITFRLIQLSDLTSIRWTISLGIFKQIQLEIFSDDHGSTAAIARHIECESWLNQKFAGVRRSFGNLINLSNIENLDYSCEAQISCQRINHPYSNCNSQEALTNSWGRHPYLAFTKPLLS